MATVTILAAATTAGEQTAVVAAGTKKSFFLTCAAGVEEIPKTAVINVQRMSGSNYVTHARMTYEPGKSGIIVEATTSDVNLKFKRGLQDAAIGVDQE